MAFLGDLEVPWHAGGMCYLPPKLVVNTGNPPAILYSNLPLIQGRTAPHMSSGPIPGSRPSPNIKLSTLVGSQNTEYAITYRPSRTRLDLYGILSTYTSNLATENLDLTIPPLLDPPTPKLPDLPSSVDPHSENVCGTL